jgi:hypothetical protein
MNLVDHVCEFCHEWKPCLELVVEIHRATGRQEPSWAIAEKACPECWGRAGVRDYINDCRRDNGLEPIPECVM